MRVLVRGVGDIGSAVAHRLFREDLSVVLHDDPAPTTTRRGMAFADAVFDRRASLEGVDGFRADGIVAVHELLASRRAIPIHVAALGPLLRDFAPAVLVDARLRKHSAAEVQRGLADFTVGLGPSLVAGRHADVIIETSWEDLGRIITDGASLALAGEPREIDGHARDRYVYAPLDGMFRTRAHIGDLVRQGQEIAAVDSMSIEAPLSGKLRGLTHDGVPVKVRTKVVEIDPRGAAVDVRGIAERPRRIADAVLFAIRDRRSPTA